MRSGGNCQGLWLRVELRSGGPENSTASALFDTHLSSTKHKTLAILSARSVVLFPPLVILEINRKESVAARQQHNYHDRSRHVRLPSRPLRKGEPQLTETIDPGKKGPPSHLLHYLKAGLRNGMAYPRSTISFSYPRGPRNGKRLRTPRLRALHHKLLRREDWNIHMVLLDSKIWIL
jgi:hypothetical protein